VTYVEALHIAPAGHQAIEEAKRTGWWYSAYHSPNAATVPADFEAALSASPPVNAFFKNLDRTNRYAILFRMQTGKKPGTRERNIQKFIAMLDRAEKIH
jgi:uncharacterized protein YdeI (YjbR/CyaY-like superfamily)